MNLTFTQYKGALRLCLAIFTLSVLSTSASKGQEAGVVKNAISKIEAFQTKLPAEKLYLHFDKPYYTSGDTAWFKAYLFNSNSLTASRQSSKLYVELINDSAKVVNSFSIPLFGGLGQGDIVLDDHITDGSYTIRAYTNWMQNFGEDVFFYKRLYIGSPPDKASWLLNEQHTVKTNGGKNTADLKLQLTDLSRKPIAYRDVELRLTAGKRLLQKVSLLTGDNGLVSTQLALPSKTSNEPLSITVIDKVSKTHFTYPFYPGGALQDIDLQFMPEGGNLVAGLNSRVAFKAVNEDGLSATVAGKIINSATGEEITTFASEHNGMGSFYLLPASGQKYLAVFTINGTEHKVDLPKVQISGVSLKVDNVSNRDSVLVYIKSTQDVASAAKMFALLAQSSAGVYFGAPVNLSAGYSNFKFPKSTFATGVVSFDVVDGNNPVAQRRIFIDNNDRLKVEVTSSKPTYSLNDSITLNVDIEDVAGKPVQGSFSLAVTDDAFVKQNPIQNNLVSNILLSSEIKGSVEDAGWYFTAGGPEKTKALDNLLLTQGWTAFNWDLLATAAAYPKFLAEPQNQISGRLTSLFKKPVANAQVKLFSSSQKYGIILLDTVSNANGEFLFTDLPLTDTIAYVVKVKNQKGKTLAANVQLNDFIAAPYTADTRMRYMPWYFKPADTLMLNYFSRPKQMLLPGLKAGDVQGKLLNEVTIKSSRKQVWINREPGYIKMELDEKELTEARKKTLMQLLQDNLPTFRTANYYAAAIAEKTSLHTYDEFCIGSALLANVYVDGISVEQLYSGGVTGDPRSYYTFLKDFFNYVAADDIKNVRLVQAFRMILSVTTRSGRGPFLPSTIGTMAYRPIPMHLPRQFYKPRYNAPANKNDNAARATLHWEPNLVTDNNGKASLTFYTAGQPSTYTVWIEGTDMNGGLGYQTTKVPVGGTTVVGTKTATVTGK